MTGSTIDVVTPDRAADCYLARPGDDGKHPAVLFMIDAIGLRPRIEEMADRIAAAGHVVPTPNVFYRAEVLPADAGNSPDRLSLLGSQRIRLDHQDRGLSGLSGAVADARIMVVAEDGDLQAPALSPTGPSRSRCCSRA